MKANVRLNIGNQYFYCNANVTEDMDLENIKKSALNSHSEDAIKDFFNQYTFGFINVDDIDKKDFKLFKDDLIDLLSKFTKVVSVEIIYEVPTNGEQKE